MKTKQVRVRLKDIKFGRILYVAHPVYGIEKVTVRSKPFLSKHTNSLFVKAEAANVTNDRSLCDMGVSCFYNSRRTFFKLKQAEAYCREKRSCPVFIKQHNEHLTMLGEFDSLFDFDY